MSERWKIQQLQQVVSAALGNAGQPSARVRDVPDTRTIRYYTTLGLLERPVEMRGRTAYYDRRHVSQLVAIKRLQRDGLTLSKIQEKLVGLPRSSVTRIAKLPNDFWNRGFDFGTAEARRASKAKPESKQGDAAQSETRTQDMERATRFWSAPPALPDAAASAATSAIADDKTSQSDASATEHSARFAIRIPITEGAILEIDSSKLSSLSELDLQKLQPFITDLADELKRQGATDK